MEVTCHTLDGRTPAQIKSSVNAGTFADEFMVGEPTALIPLNGNIGGVSGVTFNDYKVRFKVMDIDDTGHPIFMLWENEDGVPIGLTPTNYDSTYIEANKTGICMNRKGQIGSYEPDSTLGTNAKDYGPNKNGWSGSYCRGTLMPQFKNLLPKAWRDIIITTTVWTDNKGGVYGGGAGNITSTTDDCFLPDEYELFGTNRVGNEYCSQKQKHWAYPKAGNSLKAFRHDKPTTAADWFERGPYYNDSMLFCAVYSDGTMGYARAARPYGLRPCFRV